jgi:fatty-acyl-CoA synthase
MPSLKINTKRAREAWIRALERTARIEAEPEVTLPLLIERLAGQFGAAPALAATEASMSYGELAGRCNQYARWGLLQGLRRGDGVSLVMSNCAEYLAVWLGLTRIGVTVALANTQLTAEGLAYSVRVAAPRMLIAGADLAPLVVAARAGFARDIACWVYGMSSHDLAPIDLELARLPVGPLPAAECALPSIDDTALLIYTSGTTGLPKAARVSHYRLMQWTHWFAGLMDISPADRMYNCLPLYHSVGGVVAAGATLVGGATVVIRARFSASDFWRDVREQRCTLFQYIGELCRYLVNAPVQALETQHDLRLACGNGLRPEVWQAFQARFRIPQILEYYASTEGNFSLYNCEGEPGSIGRIPPFLAHRLSVELVRFDAASGELKRDGAGFCERCGANEVGEAVGLIPDSNSARAGRFEGYSDAEASAGKILRDVFTAGDAWYRTGDLMRRDERGFYYFVDRVGDTFRWKGENVSTTEVMAAIAAVRGVVDSVVYGVSVPGADGRAGMAALVVDGGFDLGHFREQLTQRLPSYARPIFLRLLPALETTGTFKPRKQELIHAGFDPGRAGESLFVDDARARAYVPLDRALYRFISEGAFRF